MKQLQNKLQEHKMLNKTNTTAGIEHKSLDKINRNARYSINTTK
jgi:hypothetical protein